MKRQALTCLIIVLLHGVINAGILRKRSDDRLSEEEPIFGTEKESEKKSLPVIQKSDGGPIRRTDIIHRTSSQIVSGIQLDRGKLKFSIADGVKNIDPFIYQAFPSTITVAKGNKVGTIENPTKNFIMTFILHPLGKVDAYNDILRLTSTTEDSWNYGDRFLYMYTFGHSYKISIGTEKKEFQTNVEKILGNKDNNMRIEAIGSDVKVYLDDHLLGQYPNTNQKLLPKLDVYAGDAFNKAEKMLIKNLKYVPIQDSQSPRKTKVLTDLGYSNSVGNGDEIEMEGSTSLEYKFNPPLSFVDETYLSFSCSRIDDLGKLEKLQICFKLQTINTPTCVELAGNAITKGLDDQYGGRITSVKKSFKIPINVDKELFMVSTKPIEAVVLMQKVGTSIKFAEKLTYKLNGADKEFDFIQRTEENRLVFKDDWLYLHGEGVLKMGDRKILSGTWSSINSNSIVKRVCSGCVPEAQVIFYKRLTHTVDLDMQNLFLDLFHSSRNVMGRDFNLYSSLDDALSNQNAWLYCNACTTVGFPCNCGPTETTKIWTNWNDLTDPNRRTNYAYYLLNVETGMQDSSFSNEDAPDNHYACGMKKGTGSKLLFFKWCEYKKWKNQSPDSEGEYKMCNENQYMFALRADRATANYKSYLSKVHFYCTEDWTIKNKKSIDLDPPSTEAPLFVSHGTSNSRKFSDENKYSYPVSPIKAVSCTRQYCDDKVLHSIVQNIFTGPANDWTDWIHPYQERLCGSGKLVDEMECQSHNCQHIKLRCRNVKSNYKVLDTHYWTDFSSGYVACKTGHYVSGMGHNGHYGSIIRLRCSKVVVNASETLSVIESVGEWVGHSDGFIKSIQLNDNNIQATFAWVPCDKSLCSDNNVKSTFGNFEFYKNFGADITTGPKQIDLLLQQSYPFDKVDYVRVTTIIQQSSNDVSGEIELEKTMPMSSGNPKIELKNLRPGKLYNLKLDPVNENGNDLDGSIGIVEAPAVVPCSCEMISGDKTGAPTTVNAEQIKGYVYVTFKDNSACEEAFAIQRIDPDGSTHVVAPNYYYFMNDACNTTLAPGKEFSDNLELSKLLVGERYNYCVGAVASNYMAQGLDSSGSMQPFLSSSSITCKEHVIKWEASLKVKVSLKRDAGGIPVQEALVSWTLCNIDNGTVISDNKRTDSEGLVKIELKSSDESFNNAGLFKVGVNVIKEVQTMQNGTLQNVTHEFLCDDETNLCPSEYITYLRHLEFDKPVLFADNTSVPIEGIVSIDNTGCPVHGAEVCLERKLGSAYVATNICAFTERDGSYKISATLGTKVRLDVQHHNHSFVGKETKVNDMMDNGLVIESGRLYADYDFLDVEKIDLIVEVAGGACDKNLGRSKIQMEILGCQSWQKELHQTMVSVEHRVPKQVLKLTVNDVRWTNDKPLTKVKRELSKSHRVINLHKVATQDHLDIDNFDYVGKGPSCSTVDAVELRNKTCDEYDEKHCIPDCGSFCSPQVINSPSADPSSVSPSDENVTNSLKVQTEDGFIYNNSTNVCSCYSNLDTSGNLDGDGSEEHDYCYKLAPGSTIKDKNQDRTVRFQYDGELTLLEGVEGVGIIKDDIVNASCRQNCPLQTGAKSCSNHVVKTASIFSMQLTFVNLLINKEITEDKDIVCNIVKNNIKIKNELGPDNNSKNQLRAKGLTEEQIKMACKCEKGCDRNITYDEETDISYILEKFVAGPPKLSGNMFVVKQGNINHQLIFAVTGDEALEGGRSIQYPTHKPLLVLRDPPGGNSFVTYENIQTSFFMYHDTLEIYEGYERQLTLLSLADNSLETCAGLGVSLCTSSSDYETEGGDYFKQSGSKLLEYNENTDTYEFSSTWSYSTSQNVELAGKKSDVALVPNIDVQYVRTRSITWDATTCTAMINFTNKYLFDSDETKPAFSFVSFNKIIGEIIPKLKISQKEANADSGKLEPEKVFINDALRTWESFVETYETTNKRLVHKVNEWFTMVDDSGKEMLDTKSDEKEKVSLGRQHWTGLIPQQFDEDKKSTKENDLISDKSKEFKDIERIYFSGGGSTMELKFSMSKSSQKIFLPDNPNVDLGVEYWLQKAIGDRHEVNAKSKSLMKGVRKIPGSVRRREFGRKVKTDKSPRISRLDTVETGATSSVSHMKEIYSNNVKKVVHTADSKRIMSGAADDVTSLISKHEQFIKDASKKKDAVESIVSKFKVSDPKIIQKISGDIKTPVKIESTEALTGAAREKAASDAERAATTGAKEAAKSESDKAAKAAKEGMKKAGKEAAEVAAQKQVQAAAEKAAKEAATVVAEKAAKEAAEIGGEKVAREVAQNIGKEVAKEAAKKAAEKAAKEAAKEATEKAAKKAVKEISEELLQQISERLMKDIVGEIAQQVAKEVTDNVAKLASSLAADIAEEVSARVAKEVSKEVTEELIEKVGKKVAEELSEIATSKFAKEAAEKAAKKAKKFPNVGGIIITAAVGINMAIESFADKKNRKNEDWTTTTGSDGNFMFQLFGFGFDLQGEEHQTHETKDREEEGSSSSSSASVSLVLGDPNEYDEFVLDIYLDPIYKTFVFDVISGISSCPFEGSPFQRLEDPRMKTIGLAREHVPEDQPIIFNVEMKNNQNTDLSYIVPLEVAIDQTSNPYDLRVEMFGTELQNSHLYQNLFNGSAPVLATIAVYRGPLKHDYPPLKISLRSQCETQFPLITGRNAFIVELNNTKTGVSFTKPCPKLRWADDLIDKRYFEINEEYRKQSGTYPITVSNPNSAKRLKGNTRLMDVTLNYRPLGSSMWLVAGEYSKGSKIRADFSEHEDTYGYATLEWNFTKENIQDGTYEFIVKSNCHEISGSPAEYNSFSTEVVQGVFDYVPPTIFGKTSIDKRKAISVESEILIHFSEIIKCTKPYTFALNIANDDVTIDKNKLKIICEQNTIRFLVQTRFQRFLMGKNATLEISDVQDAVGNIMETTYREKFAYFDKEKDRRLIESTIYPVTKGIGCDGVDQNFDGIVDDCEEDKTPPSISIGSFLYDKPGFPNVPFLQKEVFSTVAEAKSFLKNNLLISDDCATDLNVDISTPTASCDETMFDVKVTDPRCGEANPYQTVSKRFLLRVDNEPPKVSAGFHLTSSTLFYDTKKNVLVVEESRKNFMNVKFWYKVEDNCSQKVKVDVTVKSNENSYDKSMVMMRILEDVEQESQLQVYVEPSSCKTKEENEDNLCEWDPQAPLRVYEIYVKATDYGGHVANSTATVVLIPKMKEDGDVPSKHLKQEGPYDDKFLKRIIANESRRYVLETIAVEWDL